MKTGIRLLLVALLVAALVGSESLADFMEPGKDGWYTWRVSATAKAPESCCFSWNSGAITRKGCDLDSRHGNYGSIRDAALHNGELQIYARMKDGKPVQIRALSSQCPVAASSEITDLGTAEVDGSIDWLQRYIEPRSEISSDAIMAISLHSGDRPISVLVRLASKGSDWDSREQALFWLAQSDSDAAYEYIDTLF